MADFVIALKEDLVEQFKGKPNIQALVEVISEELQQVYDFYAQLRDYRAVQTATGKQLDGVGDIVVLTRMEAGILAGDPIPFEVMGDDMYRQYLIFKILKNTCDCTYPNIIKAFRMFWDRPLYYTEDPEQPATMIFDTGEMEGAVDTRPLFNTPLLRAAGVTLKLYARTHQKMPPAPLHIRSGLGLAVTVTEIRNVEPEYSFENIVRVRAGFVRETIDSIDNTNPAPGFSAQLGMHSGLQRITHDTMPRIDPKPGFSFRLKLGDGFQRISQDTVTRCEIGMTFASTAKVENAVSIMETPIRSKSPRKSSENGGNGHG